MQRSWAEQSTCRATILGPHLFESFVLARPTPMANNICTTNGGAPSLVGGFVTTFEKTNVIFYGQSRGDRGRSNLHVGQRTWGHIYLESILFPTTMLNTVVTFTLREVGASLSVFVVTNETILSYVIGTGLLRTRLTILAGRSKVSLGRKSLSKRFYLGTRPWRVRFSIWQAPSFLKRTNCSFTGTAYSCEQSSFLVYKSVSRNGGN